MGSGPGDPLVVDTSWGYRLNSALAPVILLAVAAIGWSAGGIGIAVLLLGLAGVLLGVAALWDAPWSVRFGPEGVERRCALRRQRLDWDDLVALERLPKRAGMLRRRLFGDIEETNGLVARVPSGRRVLLYTHRERPDQLEALKLGVGPWGAAGIGLPG